jgi:hypothetical protein
MKYNFKNIVRAMMSVCVLGGMVSSCADEVDLREPDVQVKTQNVEVPVLIEQDKLVYINETYNAWFDGTHLAVNGTIAMTTDVEHTLPVIEMAAEEHKAATITDANNLLWKDSNGQTTNGKLDKIESNDGSYELFAALTPSADYSTLTSLHKKVSMVTCNYELTGNLLLHTNNGDISNPIDFKMQRPYLLVDPSVDIEIVNTTDTLVQIVVKTDTLVQEKVITKTDTVEVKVEVEKLVPIISNVYFDGQNITINNSVAASVDVEHTKPIIEMAASKHKAARITSTNGLVWNDNNGQVTNGRLNIIKSTDGSYELTATLKPASNYSTMQTIHPKVSIVTTKYIFAGTVKVKAGEETVSKNFSFDLNRRYFLVDPSIDIKNVEIHDTTVVIRTDTIINTVTVRDTVNVEVDRFVKGSDVNTVVVNDFGSSIGTMTMGEKQLLQVTLTHQKMLINVSKDVFGVANFSNVAALRWNGSDTQVTTGNVSAVGCNVNAVTYLRSEFKDIVPGSMKQVRTIYSVTGTYTNENGDTKPFSFEMAPSYVQSYEEIVPVNTDPVYHYEVDEKFTDDESGEVKTRMATIKVRKYDQDNKLIQSWRYRGGVVISGHVSGYDLFVKSTEIVNKVYTEDEAMEEQYHYTKPVEGNEQFVESKTTHMWRYQNHWVADAGGDIYTDSHLMFQSVVVTFTDGDFTYTSPSFVKTAKVTYDKIDQDSDMVGKTKSENGKNYVYGGTHRLTVTNVLDGEDFFTSTATSPLWVVK